jgi:hypothetical protein
LRQQLLVAVENTLLLLDDGAEFLNLCRETRHFLLEVDHHGHQNDQLNHRMYHKI